MSALDVRDLSVHYGPVAAVNGVGLTVEPGEIVAILGPSGSGKSSLLRGIAGLEPASGDILWDGDSMATVPVHKRGFVVMFQDGQLFPHLDVAGNVAYGLMGLPRAERDRRVRDLLGLVGLEGYEERPITALSGGQAQRVALARSLAPRPRLLLLDEPLSSLDRALREHLVDVLGDTLRATHTTSLYVTHDQAEAFALADRIGVMMDGQLRQLATPSDLWKQPVDHDVAKFLGYGPFLPGEEAATFGLAAPVGLPDANGPKAATAPPGGGPEAPHDGNTSGTTGRGATDRATVPQGETVLAMAPGALVVDPRGIDVPVLATRARRGGVEATVRLPGGQRAVVDVPHQPGSGLRVRIDASVCVWLPAPRPPVDASCEMRAIAR